jgi:oxygen-dependent protoporphyrinogen oxidase
MMPPRVVVVGGGVTGLALACSLQEEARRRQAPLTLTVLEAASAAGGHARTIRADGFVVETGPNGFLSREPETLALVDALGLRDRLVEASPAARRRYIVRDGRLCRVPDSPQALLTSTALSWRGKLRLLGEPWAAAPPGHDETVHAFATRRIGREAADMLVDTAVSGISAGDSHHLSVSAQFPMMTEMERAHGGLVRAMLARLVRRTRGAAPSRLMAFDGGMRVLSDAMAARLGPQLRLNAAVAGVERAGQAWSVRLASGDSLHADHVVLAAPGRAAAPLVGGLDPALAAALSEIPYSGLAVVALGYRADDIPRALDGYGYLVTRAEALATLGVLWESSIFPNRAPDGRVLLRAFLGGARRPELAVAGEVALVDMARQDLRRVLGVVRPPVHVSVFRWPQAIAQYTLGHVGRIGRIRECLRRHPGLALCGTSYDGVSFNQAVAAGRSAARGLESRLWDEAPSSAAVAGASGRSLEPATLSER